MSRGDAAGEFGGWTAAARVLPAAAHHGGLRLQWMSAAAAAAAAGPEIGSMPRHEQLETAFGSFEMGAKRAYPKP